VKLIVLFSNRNKSELTAQRHKLKHSGGSRPLRDKLRVGVVGCGVGKAHIEGFQSLPDYFKVDAVCDLDRQKAREVADECKIPYYYTEFAEINDSLDLDIIDICTPPYQHFSLIMQALSAGKHVICEKPLVGSLQEIDELILAERDSGKRIMPILQYRFGQGIQKLKMLLNSGIAGQPYLTTVDVAWRRGSEYYVAPWRGKWSTELGGAILSNAIHALDLFCFISGPIQSVYTRTATLVNPIEVEDCAAATFSMKDGSLASFSVTLGSIPEITRHRFCFQHLTAESNSQPYTNSDDPWKFSGDTPETERKIANLLEHFSAQPNGFEGQFKLFYEALQSGAEIPVTMLDSRNITEVITAMYSSAQTGKAVELPVTQDHPMYGGWIPSSQFSPSSEAGPYRRIN
jgi:predicted dehydrogenase